MGFNHSVKVPTQYRRTAAVLRTHLKQKTSLKTLIFNEKHARLGNMKAVITRYIENRADIDTAIEKSKILEENPRFDPELCKVLVTELLKGRGQLTGDSKPVQIVRQYREKLLQEGRTTDTTDNQHQDLKPRYVRVNTNIISVQDAIAFFESKGWKRKIITCETYDEYLDAVRNLKEDEYFLDMHVDNLIVFHKNTRAAWASFEAVNEKKFMLQDKATSLVTELLRPPPGSVVLDMCAAPGMKTIHMSNIMWNKGTIYSVEQDKSRYNILSNWVKTAGATIVRPILADALTISDEQCPSVEYILVDPSCSGSGMQNRMTLHSEDKDADRLEKLAGLQMKILTHAMTAFPNVKRIAYSTCSLYEEENEQVVERCLKRCPQFKLLNGKKALRNRWLRFGNPDYKKIGKNCIYSRPAEDLTDGIFIAIFEKRRDADE